MKMNYNEPILSISEFSLTNIVTTSSQPGDIAQPTLMEQLGTAGVSSDFIKQVDVNITL